MLSFFYLRQELGFRSGLFVAAAPLALTFSGALAYAITSSDVGIAKWRLLLLVEGIPTILAAPLTWFFLPDCPKTASFLSTAEKAVVQARVIKQRGPQQEEKWRFGLQEAALTIIDLKAVFTAVSRRAIGPLLMNWKLITH